ncbi:DUF6585 family protein [Thermodesulfobacteriota bacterium]
MKEYRMTYIWRIVSLITFLPLGVLFIFAYLPQKDMGYPSSSPVWLGLGVLFILAVVFVWVYGFKKKVTLTQDGISEVTIFGSKHISFGEGTEFRHHSISAHASSPLFRGAGFAIAGAGKVLQKFAGEEAATHINVSVSDGKKKIKLGGNLKNIAQLRDELIAFEINNIFPQLAEQYERGEKISFGPISLVNEQLLIKKHSVRTDQLDAITSEIIGFPAHVMLVLRTKDSRKPFARVKTIDIANMHSFLSLLPANEEEES